MKLLTIDTASTICSVAVLEDTKLLGHKTIDDEKTHSQKLMPLVEELLTELHLDLSQMDVFGVDIGPGSFTGIRIGMATIKAFCDIYEKPVCGISSLEVLAYQVKDCDEGSIVCSMIDAKHNNIYYGFFEKREDSFSPIKDFSFASIEEMLTLCKNEKKPIIFVGNGSILFQDMIESNMNGNAKFLSEMEKNKTNAFELGLATYSHFLKQEFVDSEHLAPMYLKKSSAELQMKE